jgi:hypothetical protein
MNQLLDLLIGFSSVAGLWVFAFWIYPEFRVTQFRQQMFALRDEMFLCAMNGQMSFSDDAYKRLRRMENGFIRFAHRMSLPHFILATVLSKRQAKTRVGFKSKFNDSINHLPIGTQRIYIEYLERMNSLLIRHLFLSNPLMFFTIISVMPLSAFSIVARCLDFAKSKLSSRIDTMDTVAYVAGSPME